MNDLKSGAYLMFYHDEMYEPLINLIEDLREVARAAQDCVYGKEPLSVDEADMKRQLDALPAWVLNDE